MSERSATLLAEALKLTDQERAKLAEDILESLDGPPSDYDSMSEEDFIAELQRRSAELSEHPEQGVSWEQVKEMR
jgi:putative addiction module component (TIGR02574 family)